MAPTAVQGSCTESVDGLTQSKHVAECISTAAIYNNNNKSCFAKMMVFASFSVHSVVHRLGIVLACSTDMTTNFENYTKREKSDAFAQLLTIPKSIKLKQYAATTENFQT